MAEVGDQWEIRVDGDPDRLRELWDWFGHDDKLRGRVRLTKARAAAGQMGDQDDALTVEVDSDEMATALAGSVETWLRLRHRRGSDIKVAFRRRGDDTTFEFDAAYIASPVMRQGLRELLTSPAFQREPGSDDSDSMALVFDESRYEAFWDFDITYRGSAGPESGSRFTVDDTDSISHSRSVNVRVASESGIDVEPARPLMTDTAYTLLVNIGAHDPRSLLAESNSRWPDEALPRQDLPLRAVLRMDGSGDVLVEVFSLPSRGPSFWCHCLDKSHHQADCAPQSWVRFGVVTPTEPTVWRGELVIYHEVVAVHAQELVLPVGDAIPEGAHSRLLYRLTTTFEDLGEFSERTASIFIADGGARALVNGLKFVDNPVSISPNAADTAIRSVRQLLHDQHLRATPAGPQSKLDAQYGKSAEEFVHDLAELARRGASVYNRLFADNDVYYTLPQLIRHEAAARNRAPVLNVADATLGEDRPGQVSVPWSVVYDLAIPQDPHARFRVCPSVWAFGPQQQYQVLPPHCPEPDHDGYVLCPFGFWGLSCVLEQPPSTARPAHYVHRGPAAAATKVGMAVDPGLDGPLTQQHLARLAHISAGIDLSAQTVNNAEELAGTLASDDLDIAYLYCHGGYHPPMSAAVLRFGRSMVHPDDVANWPRPGGPWPRHHWHVRRPMIVLNGCSTMEFTSATLSNFADAFVNRAHASAVIGTEVTVEQGMAGWMVERLLRELADNSDSIGAALRRVRWHMINRGNTMGLAYTLYGLAGLRLRPRQPDRVESKETPQ